MCLQILCELYYWVFINLQEFLWYRKHTYMRLDGSSKISDRRDMVADFQTRSDIFVFLLSTRAGGLGINLTAADTVGIIPICITMTIQISLYSEDKTSLVAKIS